jgi:hypothetical protein
MTHIKPNDEWRVGAQPTGECSIPECPCHELTHSDDDKRQDQQPPPLWADAATVRAAIADVLDAGDPSTTPVGFQCSMPWLFWLDESDEQTELRGRFLDAVLLRITQLQHPPHNYPRRPVYGE